MRNQENMNFTWEKVPLFRLDKT
ncbi:MAG: hypothetical protein RL233_1751, partial [Bacteroidota bacterium]